MSRVSHALPLGFQGEPHHPVGDVEPTRQCPGRALRQLSEDRIESDGLCQQDAFGVPELAAVDCRDRFVQRREARGQVDLAVRRFRERHSRRRVTRPARRRPSRPSRQPATSRLDGDDRLPCSFQRFRRCRGLGQRGFWLRGGCVSLRRDAAFCTPRSQNHSGFLGFRLREGTLNLRVVGSIPTRLTRIP
jgi:hypothetical protein